MKLDGLRILVLGLGETGMSMVRWLRSRGAQVRVADSRAAPPLAPTLASEAADVVLERGTFRPETFAEIDAIAISPGVAMAEPQVVAARAKGIPVFGDIELFAWELASVHRGRPADAAKVIAITGSNGKTTVTAMVGAICRQAGLDTVVAGNIGPAVLDAHLACEQQHRAPQVWVLELSSFQLETTAALDADAAALLNVSQDHLDRYPDMAAYVAAKARVFRGHGVRVVNRDDAQSLAMGETGQSGRSGMSFGLSPAPGPADFGLHDGHDGTWITHGRRHLMPVSELRLVGTHNVANAMAAMALTNAIGVPMVRAVEALRAFSGLPHRMQRVAEVNGVSFIDDSKGTNVGATVAALNGLECKAVLIAGGDGKGQDFEPLAAPVAKHARAVVLIGTDAPRIAGALAQSGVLVETAVDLPQAVSIAARLARRGDAVLLSPACASFDMFRNYTHRAEVFVAAVHALPGGASMTRIGK